MARKKNGATNERPKAKEPANMTSHPHYPIYSAIDHYSISNDGCLMYTNGDKRYELCNGSIVIIEEIHKTNGSGEAEIEFVIKGITKNGKELPTVKVPASEFSSLNWITRSWGTALVVMPNQTVKQNLVAGILMSGEHCSRKRVCTHTGYIFKDGKPINYISANGPLIDSDITCEIDQNLNRYALPAASKNAEEAKAAIKAALMLLEAHDPAVTGPVFAYTFLSAILPVVHKVIGPASFLLFLSGKTQSGKSQLAALSTAFFGCKFDSQTPPTTFASTANAIMVMAFILKDMSLWVDDYNPQEYMKAMNQIFQMLARAAGDHSTRRRLDSNSKLKESYPPRCLFLVTGEFPPKVGHSGHARIFQVDVPYARKDITEIKKAAREGILSRAMSDYILYIISNYDKLTEIAKAQYEELTRSFNEMFGECRLSNQVSLLCLSAYMYLDYANKCKAITTNEATQLYRAIEASIIYNARKKEEQLKQEDPCSLFINAVKDMLSSGRAKVIDLSKKDCPEEVQKYPYTSLDLGPERDGYIGWLDEKGYYLNTNASYSAVTAYYLRQDMSFITQPNTLWRQLRDSGYLIPDKNNTPCQTKKIGKSAKRVLCFPRKVFDMTED